MAGQSREALFLLAAMSWGIAAGIPLYAQAHTIADDAGVTVNLNGSQLIHRSPIQYPGDAMAKGVVGSVAVQLSLKANGEVLGAAVLSGPGELGVSVRESVAKWHFDGRVGGTTREVTIGFAKPADTVAAPPAKSQDSLPAHTTTEVEISDAPPQPPAPQSGTIDQIDVTALSAAATAELLAEFPVHAGDRLAGDVLIRAAEAAQKFDSHLTMEFSRGVSGENVMKIRPKGMPAGAMPIKAERPLYPPLAKMARQHGVVKFEATIGKDGSVEDLQLISGPPLLVSAAKDAVANWVYQRTEMDGIPVKMATTIYVNFDLANDVSAGLAVRAQ